jgi:site-specific DNA-methyltransferase (adenine-specific)
MSDIKLILGDCLEEMKKIPDKSIDLVLTSPPYDNLRDYKGYSFDFNGIANEIYRAVSEGGVCVWVVNDATINGSETGTSFKQALYFKECGFNLYDTMIYRRLGMRFPESVRYYPCFEFMFVLSKGTPKSINLLKDRKNINVGQKLARKTQDRNKDGVLRPNSAYRLDPDRKIGEYGVRWNIWEYHTGGTGKSYEEKYVSQHPATFPEKLAYDHIYSWSKEGDTVLDPMMGSGTTGKMAKILKRNFIGIEISPEYLEIAQKRINNTEEMMI